MRKFLLALLCLTMGLLLLSAASAESESATVLIYLCGSDMPNEAREDLWEMSLTNENPNLNILVQAGGAVSWGDDDNPLPDGEVCRFRLDGDLITDKEVLGAQNMGSPETLYSFLLWGLQTAPADRYMLVLWDHGGGAVAGFCVDNVFDSASIYIPTLYAVLSWIKEDYPDFRLDFLGFDACLMANYEMAAHMAPFADYLIASEELEPGNGWLYSAWLNALSDDLSIPTEELAVIIAESFISDSMSRIPDYYYSMSVIDLKEMPQMVEKEEAFVARLNEVLAEGNAPELARLRSPLYAFGAFSHSSYDMVDFMAFLDATRGYDEALAAEVEEAYEEVVRYTVCTDKFDYLTGLSLLWPADNTGAMLYMPYCYAVEGIIPNQTAFANGISQLILAEKSGDTFAKALVSEPVVNEPSEYYTAFSVTLSPEEISKIVSAESVFWGRITEDDMESWIELGSALDATIDRETNVVSGVFDGLLPSLNDRMVVMYDQINTQGLRRGVIPVKRNGVTGYLLVVKTDNMAEWHVNGFTEGFNAAGYPVRHTVHLTAGDVITPIQPAFRLDENGEPIIWEFDDEPIIVDKSGTLDFRFGEFTMPEGATLEPAVGFRFYTLGGTTLYSALAPIDIPENVLPETERVGSGTARVIRSGTAVNDLDLESLLNRVSELLPTEEETGEPVEE